MCFSKEERARLSREGVERFFEQGRLLLADDMGLGKTAQAIAACHALWHTGRIRRGLLIVPAALKPQWLREWQAFTDTPAAVVEGTPAERRAAFEACRRGFLLVNYEQLLRDVDVVCEWTPDIVVLDEAQRINSSRNGAWQRGIPRPWMERRRSAAPETSRRCGLVWPLAWSDACDTRCCRSWPSTDRRITAVGTRPRDDACDHAHLHLQAASSQHRDEAVTSAQTRTELVNAQVLERPVGTEGDDLGAVRASHRPARGRPVTTGLELRRDLVADEEVGAVRLGADTVLKTIARPRPDPSPMTPV